MALCISPSSAVFSRQLQASRPQRLRSVAVRADGAKINGTIRLDEAKVVDNITADSAKPVAYCRCWKSSTFPKCDGSHVAHNKEVGDNVGPLLVKKDA